MKKVKTTAKNRDSGFTLIELLIAASIFSVAIVVVYSTFSSGIIAFQKGERYSDSYHSVRLSINKMIKDMRNAIYSSEMSIVGNAQEIYFYTFLEEREKDPVNLSGIYKVSYAFDKSQGKFLRKEEPYISTLRLIDPVIQEKQEIPQKVTNLSFSYYGQVSAEAELGDEELADEEQKEGEESAELSEDESKLSARWQAQWKFEYGFPQKTKIELSLKDNTAKETLKLSRTINLYRGQLWEQEDNDGNQQ